MRLALPDLLATRKGRLTAFFLLYVTEGIPLGFTATAIAAQMRRQGLGPEAIGAFIASLYLPWAFKWAMGPIVDTFSSVRFGRRRLWAVGGAGVLFLTAAMPFQSTYFFVCLVIFAVTLFVVLPLREKAVARVAAAGQEARNVGRELASFVRDSWRAFTGSRGALVGVVAAVLPAGAYALSLSLQSNLAVELGLDDNQVAQINLYSTVIFAPACILGGWLSDRFGRRSTLALFIFLTVVPTLWLAWTMWQAGWIMPVDVKQANRPQPSTVLLVTFWAATIVYNVFQGLYYGIRSALFMDVTTPAVAATQFTAYMALSNLCTSYTAYWQGFAVERWGYPATLVIDSVVGLVVLATLPFMRPRRAGPVPARAAIGEAAPA